MTIAAASETALVFVELGGIILVMAVLGRIAGRLGIPSIPLFLLLGLALGEGGLVPIVTAQEFIEVGADIGVVLLLLMLGLEYTGAELTGTLKKSWPVGVVDVVANFVPGLAAGFLLGWSPLTAVVLGGITYITSSGIVAKLVEDLGWLGNRETPLVLSVLVMEDLAMAVYLPVVASLLVGGTVLGMSLGVLAAITTVAVILFVAVRYGNRLSRFAFGGVESGEIILLSVLGITLLVAALAEQLKVSAAVGAFLVGIAISGETAQEARMLFTPLRDLFAAVFFVFFGLQVDPATIPPIAGTAAILAIVTAATKLLTGYWGARRNGVGTRGRWRAGAALIARGEFSIVIASLAAGIVRPELGALASAYVLFLAIGGPLVAHGIVPLVSWLRRRSQDRAPTQSA